MVLFTNRDEHVIEESKIKIFFNTERKWRIETTKRKENKREGRRKNDVRKTCQLLGQFKSTGFHEPCPKAHNSSVSPENNQRGQWAKDDRRGEMPSMCPRV